MSLHYLQHHSQPFILLSGWMDEWILWHNNTQRGLMAVFTGVKVTEGNGEDATEHWIGGV